MFRFKWLRLVNNFSESNINGKWNKEGVFLHKH